MRRILVLLILCLACAPSCRAQVFNSNAMENMDIDEAINAVSDKDLKRMLREFRNGCREGDSIVVTSQAGHFELVVSHPASVDRTGGAEQYFLDKTTGESRMGWHEHPTPLD